MRDWDDRGRGRGFDSRGSSRGGRDADKPRSPAEESTERVRRVWQEVESASQRVERLSAITQREQWRTERKTLQQTHDTLVERVQERELDAKASAGAQEHYTNATKKLGDITTALATAQEPLRPVPPVAGEEAIEPSIMARSAVPDDVLAWVAGLDARERSAISSRVKSVLDSTKRTDEFAVDLANYLAVSRMLPQFYKVADNPRKHFDRAAYAKARARREVDANASSTGAAPVQNARVRPGAGAGTAATNGVTPPASPHGAQVGRADPTRPTADAAEPPNSLVTSDRPPDENAELASAVDASSLPSPSEVPHRAEME